MAGVPQVIKVSVFFGAFFPQQTHGFGYVKIIFFSFLICPDTSLSQEFFVLRFLRNYFTTH
tara:strand:+ start:1415 stop:1597 length:183 start_codon:yes stop_codon:yes gene_type:complete